MNTKFVTLCKRHNSSKNVLLIMEADDIETLNKQSGNVNYVKGERIESIDQVKVSDDVYITVATSTFGSKYQVFSNNSLVLIE